MSKQELWGADISDAAWLNLCPSNVRPFDRMPPPYSVVTDCIHICQHTCSHVKKKVFTRLYAFLWKKKTTTLHLSIACTVSSNNLNYSFSIWLYSLLHHFGGILAHYPVQRCSSLRFADIVPKSELWLANATPGPTFLFQSFCCKLLLWFWIVVLLYDSILA